MIAVMGATGHTGRQIAEALLAAGERVRALGRSPGKLAELERAGAEVLAGDAADAPFLTRAFRGADAVYTLLPTDRQSPDYLARQRQEGEAAVEAIRASGVRHVVFLSSLGADLGEGTGLIAGLHAQEARLARLPGVNLLLLRPVSFFENFYEQLPLVRQQGIVADSVAPDLPHPMVATRDIAEVAAKALRARDWTGTVVRELLGPLDLTHAEATRILGARIARPDLAYVQLSCEEMVGALVQAGASESFARLYVEMTRAFNEGRVAARVGRTPETATPTRFEDFAAELAQAYQAT
ncbi:MAG TPA: NAD(P)H-binding protein [Thermodesulfobacteriota bacterium]